ncbi:MAG: tape measure protein, partial [Streptococcus gallolyticus]|nr:tape measure protein [Streptococcus gallolyticus]
AKLTELANNGVSKTSEEYKKYEKELTSVEKEQAANKKSMDAMSVTYTNQKGKVDNIKSSLTKYKSELSQVESATGQLNTKIKDQQSKLDSLKSKYVDVVLEQGKNSKEARQLASDIDKLSKELQQNKTSLDDASKSADKLDKSLDIDVEKPKSAFTSLKVAAGNLVSQGISRVASAITDQLGSAISRVDTLHAYERTMKNLGFSTDEVTQASNKLKEGIQGLPTTLPSIVSWQQQYTALTGDIQKSTDLTLALNNATLAGGQGQEIANGALEQWYQIMAKGKPELQDWRIINSAMPAQMNQIAESVMGAGAKSMDLFKAWQSGTVTTEQVMNALIKLDKQGGAGLESFSKQAQDANSGIGTSFENVKTAI